MTDRPWWEDAVLYQVYPRSFQDTDGDGIGDLEGIRRRLDHFVNLGIDGVWISPIYPSPMADHGYDVSDYCGIDPIFGTLADFDRLLAEMHERGLRLILDFVPNHSSRLHPWFQQSASGRDSALRDWYVWRDPAPDGGPPNNWRSRAGEYPAWTFDPRTGQYYLHSFLPEQPDLNWRNPAVQAAMLDVLRWWLDRGVDGFRVDVIYHLMKDPEFRDDPVDPTWEQGSSVLPRLQPLHSIDHEDIHDVVRQMRRVLGEYADDRLLIGEIYLPLERLMAYYGQDADEAHLPFNFQLISAPWHAASLLRMIRDYDAAIPLHAWPNWVLGNHDQSRIASRVGPAQARVAMMLLLTLRGTPTLYYGDELGMLDVPIPPDQIQDRFVGSGVVTGANRDPQRTPMPWDEGANAGFTTSTPWLPIGSTTDVGSVAQQDVQPTSMLALTRALLALRRRHPSLLAGSWTPIAAKDDLLCYARGEGRDRLFVVLNFESVAKTAVLEDAPPFAKIILSTGLDRIDEAISRSFDIGPNEGLIVAVSAHGP